MGDIVPYRTVAGGVITDVEPFNLGPGMWSWGVNVRFRNGSMTRGPVFRTANSSLLFSSPRFLASDVPSSGLDTILVGYLNGRVTGYDSGTETDLSIAGFVNNNSEGVYTACHCNDVTYVNRSDRAPWVLTPSGSSFVALANWAPVSGPWTAQIIRSCNNAIVALNVTQNGTANPTMVITSEFVNGTGNVPSTWNYTLGTNNATENIIGDMEGPIVDAATLGDQLIIYGQNQTYRMFLTGDAFIWGIKPLFGDVGAINANCAVEVDRKHFVFGLNDIYVHDGNTKLSICDQKTREFIFNSISVTNASRCAVSYNRNLKEVYFRYMSNDAFVTAGGFPSVDGCNRQAVYHIATDTWTFDDLPYVFGAVMANVSSATSGNIVWNTDVRTWDASGGSWDSLIEITKKVMVMVGDANSAAGLTESIYAFDLQGPGSLTTFTVNLNATKGWTLIRDGIDLKEIKKDLRGYAVISSLYPQMVLEAGAQPVTFNFGTSDFYGQPAILGTPQTYDGDTLYKLDYNMGGRYLYFTATHNDYHYVNFTGIDLDLEVVAEF